MEVKGNNFYSVKPALGVEVGYSAPIMENSKFKASLGLGYEHELGKIEDNVNEAKFANTNTKINLKGAKDERRGNFKSNLKVGFEAGNFNFSVNGGYDTKDKNSHIGMGLGVSF
jgi:outer membrane autotransporter barrel domain protein